MQRFLNSLDKRSRQVFAERYLLSPAPNRAELAQKFLMSEERVRRIEVQTVKKLIEFIKLNKDADLDGKLTAQFRKNSLNHFLETKMSEAKK